MLGPPVKLGFGPQAGAYKGYVSTCRQSDFELPTVLAPLQCGDCGEGLHLMNDLCMKMEDDRLQADFRWQVYTYVCDDSNDKAHFWLNGYVNKQNCRIWSEANPQVYVETPLHPEKLTVWCALWAGGILLQKR
ncbi:hypothetical protein TNCV_964611 [Trichonephila clavipes]|nr:hypothetical protein TNCV_964611 [Trichonephila clavipes]